MLTEEGNVPEVNRQLLFEQNSFYLNTKGDAVHKPNKGPALVKEKPQPEYSEVAFRVLSNPMVPKLGSVMNTVGAGGWGMELPCPSWVGSLPPP